MELRTYRDKMRTKEEVAYIQLIEKAYSEKQRKIASGTSLSLGSLTVTQQIQLTNSMRKGHIGNAAAAVVKPAPYVPTDEPVSESPEYSPADAATDRCAEADSDEEGAFEPDIPIKTVTRSNVPPAAPSSAAATPATADIVPAAVKAEPVIVPAAVEQVKEKAEVAPAALVRPTTKTSVPPSAPAAATVTTATAVAVPAAEARTSTGIAAASGADTGGRIMKRQRVDPVAGAGAGAATGGFGSSALDKLLGGSTAALLKREDLRDCFDAAGLLCKESYSTMQFNDAAARAKAGDEFRITLDKSYVLDQFGLPIDTITMNNIATSMRENNKQTLVMKLSIPPEASRWSINIVPNGPLMETAGEVLFHFNPRIVNKNQGATLIMNNKMVRWNKNDYKYSAAQYPWTRPLFGCETGFELMIQVYPGGFVVFIDGKYCTYFGHRTDIDFHTRASHTKYGASSSPSLKLQVGLVDDYNDKPETLEVHKIWWGYRDYKLDSAELPQNILNSLLLRPVSENVLHLYRMHCHACMRIAGLPRLNSCADTVALEHTVYEMLEAYSLDGVFVPKDSGLCLIKFANHEDIDDAIQKMNNVQIANGDETYTLLLARVVRA